MKPERRRGYVETVSVTGTAMRLGEIVAHAPEILRKIARLHPNGDV